MRTEACHLNPYLIERQGLTDADVAEIVRLHNVRENVFKDLETLTPTEDAGMIRVCVSMVENLEFALQRAWKFEVTKSMHTWWFLSPHCSCPKNENWAVFFNGGEEARHIDEECVLHAK